MQIQYILKDALFNQKEQRSGLNFKFFWYVRLYPVAVQYSFLDGYFFPTA